MLDLIIYALMAWEAMQSLNPWIAYISATGGGIIRSSVLGMMSSNFSVNTILSILFWNVVARHIVRYNMLSAFRSTLSKYRPLISSISTVLFGFYGLNAAPVLGWFAYYITACGGGILSSLMLSKNLYQTVKDVINRTMWTFVEGVFISLASTRDLQIILVALFLINRDLYRQLEGRNLRACIRILLNFRLATNVKLPLLQWYEHRRQCVTNAVKPKVKVVYGCLCRRRVQLSF